MITRERAVAVMTAALWPSMSEVDREGCATPEEFATKIVLPSMNEEPEIAASFDVFVNSIYEEGRRDARFNASIGDCGL